MHSRCHRATDWLVRRSTRSARIPAGAILIGLAVSARLLGADVVTNPLLRIGQAANRAVTQVVLSSDAQRVLTGARNDPSGSAPYDPWDGSVWEVETGELTHRVESAGVLLAAAFLADRPLVLVSVMDGARLRMLDVARAEVVREFANTDYSSGPAFRGAISPDGNLIVTTHGSSRGMILPARLWDVRTGNLLRSIWARTGVVAVAFSVDGHRLLTGDADNAVRLWDLQTTNLLQTFLGQGDRIQAVAGSSDGRYVASGGRDGRALLWDAATANLLHTLDGHAGAIWGVGFSPNGELVLTGSLGAAKVWASSTGQLRRTLEPGATPTVSVAWSPDGRYVLTGHGDATARIWSAEGLGERLQIDVTGSGAELRWSLGVLQESETPAGPWQDVLGATSPYQVELQEAQRFYRLRIEE